MEKDQFFEGFELMGNNVRDKLKYCGGGKNQ